MKILVVSLLRLGDLIQQKPLLKALKGKYMDAEIHLLLNRQFVSFQDLLGDEVEQIHTFDREILQRSMGESAFNMFTCLDLLEDLISEIRAEKFDVVMNWTHNRLSAYLLGTFGIPEMKGLHVAAGRLQGLDSPWLRYFNDNMSGNYKSHFHYLELLGEAFELPIERYAVSSKKSGNIYLQCLTSDKKKNWPLTEFVKLKNRLEEHFRHRAEDRQIQILCTEKEQRMLLDHFAPADLIVCGLREAREILAKGRLLISCDTSIKHLAAEVGTTVLEISLGGSDTAKTAAFVSEPQAVKGQSACYPCVHSQACPQKSHLCAESISVERVFFAAVALLESVAPAEQDFAVVVEREIWRAYLNQSEVRFSLSIGQAEQMRISTDIMLGYQQSFESCEKFNDIFTTLQVIREKNLDTGAYFQKLSQVFSDRYATAEAAFQALKKALTHSRQLLELRKNLIEKTLVPAGGTHAERT